MLDSLVRKFVEKDYGIEVTELTCLPIGADINASIYRAESQDGTSYFIKIKRGRDVTGPIIELLWKAGIQQIIPPINNLKGQLTQNLGDLTLIVYPFVQGQNGFHQELTDDQWILLGKTLRQIHGIDVPSPIQKQIRREDYSPKWRKTVRSLLERKNVPANNEIAIKLWRFIQENIQTIHHLVDRAEELGQKAQKLSPKFVLCHSDIHAGNVLMGDNFLYIVDWDDPIMAPKERDLMFIGGGVGNVWNRLQEEKLFYQGYGPTEVNSTLLAYYRHERIVEDIVQYTQELLLQPAEHKDRQEIYNQFMAMFKPQGVVDIAFATQE
ncbi:MAG: aminoglycoside phosphotransferase family protein [Verrucomicrobia bacterium]|nr:aminoglycoside phosphotransferase family protein [Verrucomicrobiota bacterium]